jgi:hypothetical protein
MGIPDTGRAQTGVDRARRADFAMGDGMTDILASIQSRLKAPKDQENKFGGYKYRNAESILRAFKEVQPADVSLTMSDSITFIGDRLFLVATVRLHHGGNVIAEAQGAAMHALTKKGMDDAQITGACSSYARKYALCGLFAIDDSTDDPDSKDNRPTADAKPKETVAGAALRDAWRDGVEDSLPPNATPRQKAEAYAAAIIADFKTVKTRANLDGRWTRHQAMIDAFESKHPDLHQKIAEAYETHPANVE